MASDDVDDVMMDDGSCGAAAPITLDEARALRDAATRENPAPWSWEDDALVTGYAGVVDRDGDEVLDMVGDVGRGEGTGWQEKWVPDARGQALAAFIAAGPRIVDLAIAKAEEADALRAALDRLTADVLASTKGDVVAEARALDECDDDRLIAAADRIADGFAETQAKHGLDADAQGALVHMVVMTWIDRLADAGEADRDWPEVDEITTAMARFGGRWKARRARQVDRG